MWITWKGRTSFCAPCITSAAWPPLHCTGVGKTLMLNFSADKLDRYIREKGLIRLTENSIQDKGRLLEEIARVRDAGFAVDDEECETGVRCVAAPIKDCLGKVIASVSVTGPSSRLSDKRLEAVKKHVTAGALDISRHFNGETR